MPSLSSHASRLREFALGVSEPHAALPFLFRLLPGLSVAQQRSWDRAARTVCGWFGLQHRPHCAQVLFLLPSTDLANSPDSLSPGPADIGVSPPTSHSSAPSSPRPEEVWVCPLPLPNLMMLLHQPLSSQPSNLSGGGFSIKCTGLL